MRRHKIEPSRIFRETSRPVPEFPEQKGSILPTRLTASELGRIVDYRYIDD